MEEEGGTVTIPNELRSEAGLKNFKQMTLEDLRAVHDAVKNIESDGAAQEPALRRAREPELPGDGHEGRSAHPREPRDALRREARCSAEPRVVGASKKAWLRESRAEKKKIEFIARELDGGQTAGLPSRAPLPAVRHGGGESARVDEKVTEELFKPLREMTFKERLELDQDR
jgi:hypothetical protein